ncbi:MAG: autotransporter outer membrane beta-barrel domain-containing protein [Enterobacteriaceae bacterium]|nr:autotransporter outer membrane beta-barrel domain-containing protein [Enterobacteriaceae bacterium]
MKLNQLTLALPALFAVSLASYAADDVPPTSFPPKEATPNINDIIDDSKNSDASSVPFTQWANDANASIADHQYINAQQLIRTWLTTDGQVLNISNNSHSLNNIINSVQLTLDNNSSAMGNTIKGNVTNPQDNSNFTGSLSVNNGSKAYDTTVESGGNLIVNRDGEAYTTTVKNGGVQTVNYDGYAQGNIIDGGVQQLTSDGYDDSIDSHTPSAVSKAEDTSVINGGKQIIAGGEAINSYIGNGSLQQIGTPDHYFTSSATNTTLYSGAVQVNYAGADQNTTVYSGARQIIDSGYSDGTQIYGLQIISSVLHPKNGDWINDDGVTDDDAYSKINEISDVFNATIYKGGIQRIQNGQVYNTQVYGLQIARATEISLINGQLVESNKCISYSGDNNCLSSGIDSEIWVTDSTIYAGGEQYIGAWARARGTIANGGSQFIEKYGISDDTTILNGGSSYIANGGLAFNIDVVDGSLTLQGGDMSPFWNLIRGKGGYADNVNLESEHSTIYIEHNADTRESTATIRELTNNGGSIIFGRRDGSDAGKYSQLDMYSLSGNGTFVMHTNINGGQGDFLNIGVQYSGDFYYPDEEPTIGYYSDGAPISGNHNVKVMDMGQELRASADGLDPHHLIHAYGSAADSFKLVNGSVDLGAYKYYLVQGKGDDTDNWYLSPTKVWTDPTDPNNNIKPLHPVVDPVPTKPDEPGKPDEPSQPEQPNKPDEPSKPEQPNKPDEPSQPAEPGKPEQPNKPADPVQPQNPVVPPTAPKPNDPPASKPELSDSAKAVMAMANVTPTIWDGELSTLRTRLGEVRDERAHSENAWGKYITSRYRVSTDNVGYRQDMNGVMLGGDHTVELENARLLLGGLFSYTHSELDSHHGDGSVDSYGLGAYATWLHESGYYVDGVLKVNHFRTQNSADFNDGSTNAKDNTFGYGGSLEFGKHIKLESYFIEPYIIGDIFRGESTGYKWSSGMKVKADKAQSLKAEAGTTFGKLFVLDNGAQFKPYGRLAISHEFQKNNDVIINETEHFDNDMSGTVGKYGVGLTAQLTDQWETYTEINYSKGNHIETPYSGQIGIRYSF